MLFRSAGCAQRHRLPGQEPPRAKNTVETTTPPPKNTKSRTLNNAITQGRITGLNAIGTAINTHKERQTRKATPSNITKRNNENSMKLGENMSRLFETGTLEPNKLNTNLTESNA